MSTPLKEYYLSDCYGGPSSPFAAPDADALIATDLRGRPQQSRQYEFDTNAAPLIADHIVRQVTNLVDAQKAKNGIQRLTAGVRVFANCAPRTEKAKPGSHETNGSHFYVAELDNGVRLVVTPLSVLSSIKDRVTKLFKLPNSQNGLFEDGEQFRSSYAPILFNVDLEDGEHSGISLEQCDPHQAINDYTQPWHLAYVDRFGNCVTYNHSAELPRAFENLAANNPDYSALLSIGTASQRVLRGTNLNEALPGAATFYPNDFKGNIDVARKHLAVESASQRRKLSAWGLFKKAPLGSPVNLNV